MLAKHKTTRTNSLLTIIPLLLRFHVSMYMMLHDKCNSREKKTCRMKSSLSKKKNNNNNKSIRSALPLNPADSAQSPSGHPSTYCSSY